VEEQKRKAKKGNRGLVSHLVEAPDTVFDWLDVRKA